VPGRIGIIPTIDGVGISATMVSIWGFFFLPNSVFCFPLRAIVPGWLASSMARGGGGEGEGGGGGVGT